MKEEKTKINPEYPSIDTLMKKLYESIKSVEFSIVALEVSEQQEAECIRDNKELLINLDELKEEKFEVIEQLDKIYKKLEKIELLRQEHIGY